MAQRSNPALPKPELGRSLRDCLTKWERSAAHSILAGSLGSNKGRIHLRRPTCHSHFSLATKRRTIHSELATHRSQNASLQICPYEIDQVFGQFDRRSRSLFRREQVKPYVVFEDFGHQTVDAAANVRQSIGTRGVVASRRARPMERSVISSRS